MHLTIGGLFVLYIRVTNVFTMGTCMLFYLVLCWLVCYYRFLIQISAREINANVSSNFICDKWLKPEAEQQIAQCEIDVTKVQPFRYAFRVTSQQSMRDQHVWVSIFTCPQHSTFTRVQRLSCGFAIILSSMLSSIMFYKVKSPAHDKIVFSELTINLDAMVISAESALIVMPINGLIMLLFRKLSVITKGAYVVRYGGDLSNSPYKVYSGHETADDQDDTDDENTSDTITEDSISEGMLSGTSNDSSSIEDDLDGEEGDWEYIGERPINSNVNANAAADNSPPSNSGNNSNSNDNTSSSNSRSKSNGISNSSSSVGAAKTKAFALPWWFIYFAWTLPISTCLVSSFFVIAYGLSNTHYKNVAWACSFFMSVLGNICVIQPFKVAAFVMILTSLLGHSVKPTFQATTLDNLGKYIWYS